MIKVYDFDNSKSDPTITLSEIPVYEDKYTVTFRGNDLNKISAASIEAFLKSGHSVLIDVRGCTENQVKSARASAIFASRQMGCPVNWLN